MASLAVVFITRDLFDYLSRTAEHLCYIPLARLSVNTRHVHSTLYIVHST